MKKTFLILTLLSLSFYSCKKEGCTDSKANNYNSKADSDDGSCTYSTTDTTTTDTTTVNNNNGTSTTDTTNTNNNGGNTTNPDTTNTGGNVGTTVALNTATDGTKTFDLENFKITTTSGYTTLSADFKGGPIGEGISIGIKGDLPTTKTTYPVDNPYSDPKTASLTVNLDGIGWQLEKKIAGGVIIVNPTDVVIEPNANGSYTVSFTDSKLVDNFLTPTKNKTFTAKFTAKQYKSEYTLSGIAKTYKASVINCTKSATAITLTASAVNQDNKSGSLSIYLPDGATSGTYGLKPGAAIDWLNPSDSIAYINALTYNAAGTAQIWNSSQSGTVEVTKNGEEYEFKFTNIPTSDGGSVQDVLTGSATCLLK